MANKKELLQQLGVASLAGPTWVRRCIFPDSTRPARDRAEPQAACPESSQAPIHGLQGLRHLGSLDLLNKWGLLGEVNHRRA